MISLVVVIAAYIGNWYLWNPVGRDDDSTDEVLSSAAPTKVALPPVENRVFAVGEKLHYDIVYKGLTVGHALIQVKAGPTVNGLPTLQYVSTAQSTKFFDAFFKVRDQNISTVDNASLFSLVFDQTLREGRYRAERHYTFDYEKGTFAASEKRTKKGKIRNKEGTLETPLHDVLSALYFARTRDLAPGQELDLSVFRDNAVKTLPVKIGPELKELKTKLGKLSCLRVEPVLQGDSLFRSKDNTLVVWMTNDERKLPVLLEAAISVGLVRAKLVKWEK